MLWLGDFLLVKADKKVSMKITLLLIVLRPPDARLLSKMQNAKVFALFTYAFSRPHLKLLPIRCRMGVWVGG